MPYKDSDKQRAAWRAYFHRHPDRHRAFKNSKRAEISQWLTELKSQTPCQVCSESDPACIEFHHLGNNEKDFNVGDYLRFGFGRERILAEISKCLALCANCHRKLHAGRLDVSHLQPSASKVPPPDIAGEK